jgi:hypothetical protein
LFQRGSKLWLAGIAVTVFGMVAFALRALSKYLAGDGLETYRTAKGARGQYRAPENRGNWLVIRRGPAANL